MKRTCTLIAALLFISAASFAQYNENDGGRDNDGDNNYDRHRDVVVNNGYDKGREEHHFGDRERNRQINLINFEYNRKIDHVANSFFMSRHKKQYLIADLQARRENEIRFVWAKFNERRTGYNHDNNDYNNHGRRHW